MNWVNPFMLAGVTVKTGPQDRFPLSQIKLIRYNERLLDPSSAPLMKGR